MVEVLKNYSGFEFPNSKLIKLIIGLLVLVFIILPLLLKASPFFTVRYGEMAIINRLGKIERVAYPGLNYKLPLLEGVDHYSTQKIIYETSDQSDQSNAEYKDVPVDTSTSDGQQISIRYTVRFQINPEKIRWVAENLGTADQIIERIIKAESRSLVRNIAREYTATELYTGDVFKFQENVRNILEEKFDNNGLLLDEFLVRQIKFEPGYISAVEQKQIEKEKVKTEEYKAEQEKFKKQQVITQAEGQAKAQEILKLTIDPLVLQKMAIDKWNGILPNYLNGPLPFLSIKE